MRYSDRHMWSACHRRPVYCPFESPSLDPPQKGTVRNPLVVLQRFPQVNSAWRPKARQWMECWFPCGRSTWLAARRCANEPSKQNWWVSVKLWVLALNPPRYRPGHIMHVVLIVHNNLVKWLKKFFKNLQKKMWISVFKSFFCCDGVRS